jgi:hypothetical protein
MNTIEDLRRTIVFLEEIISNQKKEIERLKPLFELPTVHKIKSKCGVIGGPLTYCGLKGAWAHNHWSAIDCEECLKFRPEPKRKDW